MAVLCFEVESGPSLERASSILTMAGFDVEYRKEGEGWGDALATAADDKLLVLSAPEDEQTAAIDKAKSTNAKAVVSAWRTGRADGFFLPDGDLLRPVIILINLATGGSE